LSGAPLKTRADQVLAELAARICPPTTLIGVGGIGSGPDAVDKIRHGASLVQFYTGMVYRGPRLLGECLQAIAQYRAACT
jgi:dihydroorotate dehydrogenase